MAYPLLCILKLKNLDLFAVNRIFTTIQNIKVCINDVFIKLILLCMVLYLNCEEKTRFKRAIRRSEQQIYFWPNLVESEKRLIRDAFKQIEKRTCLKFRILGRQPTFNPEKKHASLAYAVIMKSDKLYGYVDKEVKNVARSVIYLTVKALSNKNYKTARGMIMSQLLMYMGYKEEFLRPDAVSYIKEIRTYPKKRKVIFSNEQLNFPFDPESITMPFNSPYYFKTTMYCKARTNKSLGAGQREGLLTIWDSVKINAMYCPHRIAHVDPKRGPCVVPRKRNVAFGSKLHNMSHIKIRSFGNI
uniref:Peptidase M12A domain-containing protein n=1 Tax=Rhabditophanes sp. KR3021 TaxID=114890 RepID=A0AC35U3W0_9BILA